MIIDLFEETMMKLNTLTNLILAAVATVGMSTAVFAADSADFAAQITVSTECHLEVTADTAPFVATYHYDDGVQYGPNGKLEMTAAERVVTVSSGSNACQLGAVAVRVPPPGRNVSYNLYGLPTHDGGIWPVATYYTHVNSYTSHDATGTPVAAGTPITLRGYTTVQYVTKPADADRVQALSDCTNVADTFDITHPEWNKNIPGVLSASSNLRGPKWAFSNARYGDGCSLPDFPYTSMPSLEVRPSAGVRAVTVGLGLALASAPYAQTTGNIDPLTVYDTTNGVPITGTTTMTITAL